MKRNKAEFDKETNCFEMFAIYYFKTAQTEIVNVPVAQFLLFFSFGNHLRFLNNKSRSIY